LTIADSIDKTIRALRTIRAQGIHHIGIALIFEYAGRPGVAWNTSDLEPAYLALAPIGKIDDSDHILPMITPVSHFAGPKMKEALVSALSLSTLVVHRIKFLVAFCSKIGIPIPEKVFCTHLAASMLVLGRYHPSYINSNPVDDSQEINTNRKAEVRRELAVSLRRLGREYGCPLDLKEPIITECGSTEYLIYEAGSTPHPEDMEQLWRKAAATAYIYPCIIADLKKQGLLDHYTNIEVPACRTFAELELDGVRIDKEKVKKARKACLKALSATGKKLRETGLPDPLNNDSCKRVLEDRGLGDLFVDPDENGQFNMKLSRLKDLAGRDEIIGLLYSFRSYKAALSTTLSDRFTGSKGRIYPVINPLGTDTGRPSFRRPNLPGTDRKLRPIVIPDNRESGIAELDYRQQEVGIAGVVYKDAQLIKDFNQGDVYCIMVREFIGPILMEKVSTLSDEEIKKTYPHLRDKAKWLTLGIIYGMTARGIAIRLGIKEKQAERLIRAFFGRYPDLEKNILMQTIKAAQQGYVTNITGLRRYRGREGNPTPWERRWFVNTPVQSGAASVLKLLLPRLQEYLRSKGGRILIPVYDAVVIQYPLEKQGEVLKKAEKMMIEAFRDLFPELKPRVSVNADEPGCWNKDGHSDSIERFLSDPFFNI
jgi:DNA polymerase I-like protein with 3'-5' exonuclease and polymerase domains